MARLAGHRSTTRKTATVAIGNSDKIANIAVPIRGSPFRSAVLLSLRRRIVQTRTSISRLNEFVWATMNMSTVSQCGACGTPPDFPAVARGAHRCFYLFDSITLARGPARLRPNLHRLALACAAFS